MEVAFYHEFFFFSRGFMPFSKFSWWSPIALKFKWVSSFFPYFIAFTILWSFTGTSCVIAVFRLFFTISCQGLREFKEKGSGAVTYQMYSAMILSVYGVMSILSNPSNLETTPLFSDLTARTLNVELLLFLVLGLWGCKSREFHILGVMMGLALIELLGIVIWHCMVGTTIWAISSCYLPFSSTNRRIILCWDKAPAITEFRKVQIDSNWLIHGKRLHKAQVGPLLLISWWNMPLTMRPEC